MRRVVLQLGLWLIGTALYAQMPAPTMMLEPLRGGQTVPAALMAVDVKVTVHGAVAEIATTLTFENRLNEVARGDLRFPLERGVTVSGYALLVGDTLVDGVAVERDKGRATFETVVREARQLQNNRDPGLVEWEGGSSFKTSVFPFPARRSRTMRVSTIQALGERRGKPALHLPISLDSLDATCQVNLEIVVVGGTEKPSMIGSDVPIAFASAGEQEMRGSCAWTMGAFTQHFSRDLWLELDADDADRPTAELADNGYVYAHLVDRPEKPKGRAPKLAPSTVRILWDASGSRGQQSVKPELAFLAELFDEWRGTVTVELVRFRDTTEATTMLSVRDGDVTQLTAALQRTDYDGATNFQALTSLGASARPDLTLLVTDGRDTTGAGLLSSSALKGPTYAITRGAGFGTTEALRLLVQPTGGAVVDLRALSAKDAVEAIMDAPLQVLAVQAPGGMLADLSPALPRIVDGVVHMTGKLRGPRATVTVIYGRRGQVEQTHELTITQDDVVPANHLRRLWAQARLQTLLADEQANAAAIRELGMAEGLVTPQTSLIVLEEYAQYLRFRVPPPPMLTAWRRQYQRERARLRLTQREALLKRATALMRARDYVTGTSTAGPALLDDGAMRTEFYSVPPGVFYGGDTRSSASSAFGGDDDDDDDDSSWRGRTRSDIPAPVAIDSFSIDDFDDIAAPSDLSGDQANAPSAKLAELDAASGAAADAPPLLAITADTSTWGADPPFLQALRDAGSVEGAYRTYLLHRQANLFEPLYYLLCANWFQAKGSSALADRILSNLAELELRRAPAQLLLVLGREQARYGAHARARDTLRYAARLAPANLAIQRELAFAEAAAGERQVGVDRLWALLTDPDHPLPDTYAGELMADLDHLIAGPPALTVRDPLLRESTGPVVPADIRIVATWDADSADVDLLLTGPDGETVYGNHRIGKNGGVLSVDSRGDGIPEIYRHPKAPPGTYGLTLYLVDDQSLDDLAPVIVHLDIYTHYGTPQETHQRLVGRLMEIGDALKVADLNLDASKGATR